MDPQQQPPKKLQDFNNDLKELCAKYQYELSAVMAPLYNPWGAKIGERTTIQAFDVSPKDQVPLTPTETPQTPATPADPTIPMPSSPAPVPPLPPVPGVPEQPVPTVPPVDPTAGQTPVPGMPEDGKKNDPKSPVNQSVDPSVPANPSSIENSNPSPVPSVSTPDNQQPPNAGAN